jgi:glycosyltransferase involved in cell wall biosynthesis
MNKDLFDDSIILIFPSVNWNHNWERQHELIYRFAQENKSDIYIFSPIGYMNHSLSKLFKKVVGKLKHKRDKNGSRNPVTNNMKFMNIEFYIPYHNARIIRRINSFLVKLYFKKKNLYKRVNSKKVILWCTYSTDIILDIIELLKPVLIITDIAQRRKANPYIPQYAIDLEEKLIKISDIVFADSQATCEDYDDITDIQYFCQGVSLERNINNLCFKKIDRLEFIDTPIVGYLGALHSSINYELLKFIIVKNTDYNFVFVGNILNKKAEELKKFRNVIFVGKINYDELNNYIRYFDVGIVPYLVNDFTEGVSPTKLFEYGIQKVPVVSTNLREVLQFENPIYIGKNIEEFNNKIRQILQLDVETYDKLRNKTYNLSLKNSWQSKFDFFYNKIILTYKEKKKIIRRKKIVYIISTLERCGPVNVLYQIVKNLDRELFDVYILTLSPEPIDSKYEDFNALGIIFFSVGFTRIEMLLDHGRKFRCIINKIKPDIIHSHGYRSDLLSAKYLRGYKRVNTIHNYPPQDYTMQYGRIIGNIMSYSHLRAFSKINYPTACSYSIASLLKKHNIVVSTVQNGIDKKQYFPSCEDEKLHIRKKLNLDVNKKIIVHIGAMIDRKDPITVIEAFNKGQLYREAQLVMVGDGPLLERCKNYQCESIIITGKVSNVYEYLNAADIFISVSKAEGLPMAVLEAMASGLPLILSDIEPHKELTLNNFDFGFMFEIGDVYELIYAMKKSLKSDLRIKGASSRLCLEMNFSSEIMCKNYVEIYNEI